MKKIISMLVSMLLLLVSVTTVSYAADSVSATASVNNSSKVVTIEGSISSGSGQQVTVVVVNPAKGTDYINQATSGVDGSYKFTYTLDEDVAGVYTVNLGGTGITSPVTTTFTFSPVTSGSNNGSSSGGSNNNSNSNDNSTATKNIGISTPVLNKLTGEAAASINGNAVAQAFTASPADGKGIKKVKFNIPPVTDATSYAIQLQASTLLAGKSTDIIQIVTEIGTIEVQSDMLKGSKVDDNQNVEIVIKRSESSELDGGVKAKIGNRPVIEIYLRLNSKEIPWSNSNAPVKISVTYTPADNEDLEKLTIWYIDGNGSHLPISGGRYSSTTGMVTFSTPHFSKYAIAYNDIRFKDLERFGWAKRPIEVLAAKGIVSGTSSTQHTYSPDAKITRADFITILVNTLGLTAEVNSNFKDVEKGKYYYEAVGIAKELGITAGKGNNNFNPKELITRQDMMTLTAKALKIANKLGAEGNTSNLDKFEDVSKVSSYALEGIAMLVRDGLIVGSDNKLMPADNTTRAEVAAFMYKIYNKE